MSSSVTPGSVAAPRVDVAGHGDVDDRAAAARRGRPSTGSRSACSSMIAVRAGGGEQHVDVGERVGQVAERDGPAADPRRRARRPRSPRAVGDDDLGRRPRRPARRPCPRPSRRRRARARGGRRACRARSAASATAAERHRRGAAADAGLGAGPLADLDRVAEQQVERGAGRALVLGRAPTRRATWPRISLSPMIIESSPAATPKRCATAASS